MIKCYRYDNFVIKVITKKKKQTKFEKKTQEGTPVMEHKKTKKKGGKKLTVKDKNTSLREKKTAGKKRTAPKAKKGKSEAVSRAEKRNDYICLIVLVCGILLGVFLYFKDDGFLGRLIKDFLLGLFGSPVYLLPALLIVNGIHRAAKKNYEQYETKYTLVAVGLALFSVLFHVFAREKVSPVDVGNMIENYKAGVNAVGGGLIGGFIADILRMLIGQVASAILLIAGLVCLSMSFVNWSPVKALLRLITETYEKAEGTREKAKKKICERNGDKKEPEGQDGFSLFADEDLGIEKGKKAKAKKAEETQEFTFDEDIPALDEIIDTAIPLPSDHDAPPVDSVEEEAPVPNPISPVSDMNIGSPDEEGVPEPKYVDAPERLTGMEDVSEEMEKVFERIPYTFPSVELLEDPSLSGEEENSRTELRETAQKLITTLKSFNVDAKLLNVSKGPTVTRYELVLGEGVKVSKVAGLANDLALRLAAQTVRIEPVPGKEAIGIEIPNKTVSMVRIKEVIDSDDFKNFKSDLAFAMGKDISGKNIIFNLSNMPHVLIAGSTGSGKSVCINTLITSLIYKADPNDVKLLMVDPKVVELGIYNGIPHLLIPVVTEPRRASGALYWAVQEMLRRYSLFADNNVRDIKGYNNMIKANGGEETLPHIVIIIDELADLMMVAPNEVEDSICRLAQMARAAGMHLVIATQRPSVDVITGLIKANVPSRIAFAVSSHIDSRTILDGSGAEKLLGKGDMLFKPVGANKPLRIQGAFIDDKEVERVVNFIKGGSVVRYDEDIIEKIDAGKPVNITDELSDPSDNDELLPQAIEIAVDTGKISASHLQRKLKVGFSRASRMIDQMQERGIISPPDGSKPREVLISKEELLEMEARGTL